MKRILTIAILLMTVMLMVGCGGQVAPKEQTQAQHQLLGKPVTDLPESWYYLEGCIPDFHGPLVGFHLLVRANWFLASSDVGKQTGWKEYEVRYVYFSSRGGWIPGDSFEPSPIKITSVSITTDGKKEELDTSWGWDILAPRYDLMSGKFYVLYIEKKDGRSIFNIYEQVQGKDGTAVHQKIR